MRQAVGQMTSGLAGRRGGSGVGRRGAEAEAWWAGPWAVLSECIFGVLMSHLWGGCHMYELCVCVHLAFRGDRLFLLEFSGSEVLSSEQA